MAPNGAPYRKPKETQIDFLMVIMASGIARGLVRTTAMRATVESCKMVVILEIIG